MLFSNIELFAPYPPEVHCGPAVVLPHTNFSMYGGDKVGGKVTYTCIHGYERLSGSGFSRCPLSGEWTRPTLVCEGRSINIYFDSLPRFAHT